MKEEFYRELDNLLIDKGLRKVSEKREWKKSYQVQGHGMTMNINGQQFQQPGQIISIEYRCEVIGDGSVDDKEFSQINFQVKQGEDLVVDIEECIYYDEIEIVRNIINRIYK